MHIFIKIITLTFVLIQFPVLKRPILIILIFLTVCYTAPAQPTEISGVVNSYHKVVDVITAKSCVRLNNTTGLSNNDKVMLIQMKGADISLTNNSAFGNITSLNNAGNYEINQICNVIGDSVFLSYTILNNYTPDGKVQLVRIPVYTDVLVTDSLKAAPWDNATGLGGVLSIQVDGTLTLDAPVSASGAGFKGGSFVTSSGSCFSNTFTSYYYNGNNTSPQNGAFKGEGIVDLMASQSGGRGPAANGGGGGNNHNNSGAGGSNLTNGGDGGGNSSTTGCTGDIHGLGGNLLSSNSGQKIYLGGGGGAGHANNTTVSSGGGNGGGIIFLQAGTIESNDQTILSNGKTGGNTTGDGASGGGAGGTIIMNVGNYSGNLSIEAIGGRGGNENNELILNRCYADGGGGSGGAIYFNDVPTISYLVSGGSNGIITNSNNCASLINGLPGDDGQTFLNYTYTASTTLANACSLILPVTLISFSAKKNQNNTHLIWEAGNIDELEKFEIEHSMNSRDWIAIKTVEATESPYYQWNLANKLIGHQFYRLKIHDTHGSWKYSHVEKIYRNNQPDFSVFPNPAKDNLYISGDLTQFSIIRLTDISGRIILTKKITENKLTHQLSLPALVPGIYMMHANGQVQKIIIH